MPNMKMTLFPKELSNHPLSHLAASDQVEHSVNVTVTFPTFSQQTLHFVQWQRIRHYSRLQQASSLFLPSGTFIAVSIITLHEQ